MKAKHPILAALLKWLAPPIAIALALWLTPSITLRTADAGAFVSANRWAGKNAWDDPVTTVRTTRGTLVVDGVFSALQGEPLEIRDTNKLGIVVCAARPSATCAELSGSFVGAFTPVPGARVWLPYGIRWWLKRFCWLWAGLGAIWFLIVWMGVHEGCDGGAGTPGPAGKAPSA